MRKQKIYKALSDLVFLLAVLFCFLSVVTLVMDNTRMDNELTEVKAINDELTDSLDTCRQELVLQDSRRQLYLAGASVAFNIADRVIKEYDLTASGINSSAQRYGYNISMATYDQEIAEHVESWAEIYLEQCKDTEYTCTYKK